MTFIVWVLALLWALVFALRHPDWRLLFVPLALALTMGGQAAAVLAHAHFVAHEPGDPDHSAGLEATAFAVSLATLILVIASAYLLSRGRRTKVALVEAEQRFATLAEHLDGVLWLISASDGAALYVSSGYDRLWQRPGADLEAAPDAWLKSVHPDDREIAAAGRAKVAKEARPLEIEYRLQRPDGGVRWVYERLSPVQDASGAVVQIAAYTEDITERRESAALLETISRQIPEALLLIEPDLESDRPARLLHVNDAAAQMHGYAADEMIGMPLMNIISDRDAARAPEIFRRLFAGETLRFETTHIRRDGSTFMVEVAAVMVDYAGRPVILALDRDITEAREAERALRESEARFRELAENIDEVFWISEPATGRTIYVTPAFRRIWKREPSFLLGDVHNFMESIHPDDRDMMRTTLRRRSEGRPTRTEYRILRPDGSVRWIRGRSFPVKDEYGNLVRSVGFAEDVTDRVRANRALRRLLEATVAVTGDALFAALAREIASVLSAKFVYIGEIDERRPDWMRQLACVKDGHAVADCRCSTAETACAAVVAGNTVRDQNVSLHCRLGKDDEHFGAPDFLGVPMRAPDGSVAGVVIAAGDEPFDDALDPATLVGLFASRAASELVRVRADRELALTQRRLAVVVQYAPVILFALDPEGICTVSEGRALEKLGLKPGEVVGRSIPEMYAASEEISASLRHALAGEELQLITQTDNTWWETRYTPMFNEAGEFEGTIGVAVDITQRRRAEERQAFMVRELDHRVKNNLAAVLTLAEQTIASCGSLEEFRQSFLGRIKALARTHASIARTKRAGASLRYLIDETLNPYADEARTRVHADGAEIELDQRCAGPVAMALHELATNAAKYGALSALTGRIDLRWSVEGADGARVLRIRWTESGGPPVQPPEAPGVGMGLIEGAIAYDLPGEVHFDFHPDGLRCDLTVPLDAPDPEDNEDWREHA